MKETFSCSLPIPPSVNGLYPTGRSGRRFKSREYSAWILNAQGHLRRTRQGLLDAKQRYAACYEFTWADNRKRDIENFLKALSDFLVSEGVIGDDSQIDKMFISRETKFFDGRNSGYVHVRIREIDVLDKWCDVFKSFFGEDAGEKI